MKNKKKRKREYLGVFFLIILILVLSLLAMFVMRNNHIEKNKVGKYFNTLEIQENTNKIDIAEISSKYIALYELDSWNEIYKENSSKKMYPASLTKMITAIILIEESEDLNEEVELDGEMFERLYKEGASMAGFLPGEIVTKRDLLYGILLPSGAECCVGLAEYIAGSERAFVEIMNQKAEMIGMKNTHFENSTGLNSYNHYSTVEDMALLLKYALQYETFEEAFTAKTYYVQPTNMHVEGMTLYSRLFNDLSDPSLANGKILGGKTGYTEEAGLCLASLAEVNGKKYILVTAGAEGNHETRPYHIEDAQRIYNSI